jgi:hypothetical protein
MSGTTPYIDTDPDMPEPAREKPAPHIHPDCLICGHHDEFGSITLRVAWFREPEKIISLPRCLDVEACRSRVAAAGEAWPLLEHGEQPSSAKPPRADPLPPKEAPDVDYF